MAFVKEFPEGRVCNVERTLAVIGPKWTTLILRELFTGTKRFGELRRTFAGISPKTLTGRLRDLEDQGLVRRTVYPEIPPRVEYTLTPRGETLEVIIAAMAAWGAQDRAATGDAPTPDFPEEHDLRRTPQTSKIDPPPDRRSVSTAGRRLPLPGSGR